MDEVTSEITGTETTIPNTTPVSEPASIDFKDIVPESYADKPWVSDIKDVETMFKMTDDLKSQLGKRPAGIPQDGEDWSEFNKALGVPENIDGYSLPEGTETANEYQNAMREAALKAGLRPAQWAEIQAANDQFFSENQADPEAQSIEFEQMVAETFGERKDQALEIARNLLIENAPEKFKAEIDNLPNKELLILTSVLDSIQQKYISEGDIPRAEGGPVGLGMTQEERIAEGTRLMQQPAYSDKSHPGHAELYERVGKLFGTL